MLGAAALVQPVPPALLHARTLFPSPTMLDRTTSTSTTESGSARTRTYATPEEPVKAKDGPTLAQIAAHVWLDGPLEREGRVGGAVRALFMDAHAKSLVGSEEEDKGFVSDSAYANLPASGRVAGLR